MFRHLAQWLRAVAGAYERRRVIEDLSRFSDQQLADLGLERGTISDLVAGLPFPEPEPARESVRNRKIALSLQGCG